jgi:hypothetical protein
VNRVEKVTEALKEFDASIRCVQWRPGSPISKEQYAADRAALNKIRKQVVNESYANAKMLMEFLPVQLQAFVPKSVRFLIKYESKTKGA